MVNIFGASGIKASLLLIQLASASSMSCLDFMPASCSFTSDTYVVQPSALLCMICNVSTCSRRAACGPLQTVLLE